MERRTMHAGAIRRQRHPGGGGVAVSRALPGHRLERHGRGHTEHFAPVRLAGAPLVLAAGAGLSRIAVGAHWPGDVAVGASLGLLSGLLGHQLWIRLPERQFAPSGWWLRIAAVLVALSVYHLLTEELDFAENHVAQQVLAVVLGRRPALMHLN